MLRHGIWPYEAVEETEGGSFGALERSLNKLHTKGLSTDFKTLSKNLGLAGSAAGESGKTRLINGKEPKEIEQKLRDRVIHASIPLPGIN